MEPEISKALQELIELMTRLSLVVVDKHDKHQQRSWLNILLGFKEEIEVYEEALVYPSVETSMINIVNNFNNLSDEDRSKFITQEQMDALKKYVASI
jgi:hypothetical protein